MQALSVMTGGGFDDRPAYDRWRRMEANRAPRASDFAVQILDTAAPFLSRPFPELDVLDVGCGYGHTTVELARRCARVVGLEPSLTLYRSTRRLQEESGVENLVFYHQGIYELREREAYDLIVLDNVLEHLPDQPRALAILSAALRPGGVLYVVVPNKLWPIEVHYGLPFLSYLPVRLANWYLRLTRRGTDYTDASFAPTYSSLNRMFRARSELSFQYVEPAHLELATWGKSLHYRVGVRLLRYCPWLWIVSKIFLVIAKKHLLENPG